MSEKDLVNMDDLDDAVMQGTFGLSLIRGNSKIKHDRALEIVESAQMKYKRKIEDLEQEIKQYRRDRRGMLDLSPTTAMSLMVASDFDASIFVDKDIELGVKIRLAEIKLDIAKERYTFLFEGGK